MARDRILQIYRGTTAQNDAFTGAQGELTMDTTLNELRVHDGITPGGHKIGGGVNWGGIGGTLSDQTDLQIALSGKVDKGHQVIEFQEPTTANNYTWYRKYADGWVEQGGIINLNSFSLGSGSTYNWNRLTFPVALARTPTDIYISDNMQFFNNHHWSVNSTGMQIKTSNQLPVSFTQGACEINWRVSGMIAS